jgi:putative intracellular protease/amidase
MSSHLITQIQQLANQKLTAAILLYEGMPAIEVVGPYEALSLVPGVTVQTVAEQAGPQRCDSGMMSIVADYTLDDLPRPDILVIPGGNINHLITNERLLAWLRAVHATTRYTTAMCVGSALLGAAGLLWGVRVATLPGVDLPTFGAIRTPGRLVADGKIITGMNAATSIDLGIYLAALLAGPDTARAIQIGLEYDLESWHPPYTPRPAPDASLDNFDDFMEVMRVNARWSSMPQLT